MSSRSTTPSCASSPACTYPGRRPTRRRPNCSRSTTSWQPNWGSTADELRIAGRRRACSSATPLRPAPTPVAMAYAGHQFGGYLAAARRRPGAAARRDRRPLGATPRPAPQGIGPHAVRPWRRRQGGRRPDAARVRDQRGDARARRPDDPIAGRRRDRRAVARETMLPGAVLVRVAASHLRVGTFQYAAGTRGSDARAPARRLRHRPPLSGRRRRSRTRTSRSSRRCADAQASLDGPLDELGFIHGVMNTDNMTISGETIDYGPCAFMDATTPPPCSARSTTVGGTPTATSRRSPSGISPAWPRRCCRCSTPTSTRPSRWRPQMLQQFPDRYRGYWSAGDAGQDRARRPTRPGGDELVNDLLELMHAERVDSPACFRALSRGRGGREPIADCSSGSPPSMRWLDAGSPRPATIDGSVGAADGDGPRQPDLHPAQPSRRRGARGGDRGRPRTVPATRRRAVAAVRTSGPGSSVRPSPPIDRLRAGLPDVLRHLTTGRRSGSEGLGVVAADLEPSRRRSGSPTRTASRPPRPRPAPGPPAVVAADALVADERPRLALVGPVVGLQPVALDEVGDRRVALDRPATGGWPARSGPRPPTSRPNAAATGRRPRRR